ncbi:MAG: hypothetical protein ACYC6L_05265 [Anaerolineae bacterium]
MSRYPAICFSAYTPLVLDTADEQQVCTLAEGGVHYAILGYDGFFELPRERQLQILEWCSQYGVEVILHDPALLIDYSDTLRENFDKSKAAAADWYRELPNFAGNHLIDEPGTVAYEALGKSVEDYKRAFPGKIPWINLLPMYANVKQLTGGAWMANIEYYETPATSYQQYLDEYIAQVDTDYIAVDIYPCHHKAGIKVTYPGYLRNIEMVADACRASGRAFWVCVQSCSWNLEVVRIPDAADVRWQVYTMLSFGASNLIHYVYAGRPHHWGSPVDIEGHKGPLWEVYRDLAVELAGFADIYGSCRSLGAFSHNCTADTPYLEMANPYTGFKAIGDIQCDDPLLVGCFGRAVGGSAFTLVNMSDLVLNKTVTARIKINGATVTSYCRGQACVLEPEGGYYTFTLPCGDGVFVTVE